jgi:16S rRNA processing protein RimM
MKKNDLVHVGTFGQPQGLKGDIKINILTASFESFKILKNYFMEDGKTIFHFTALRKIGKKNIASLEGCEDRNAALNYKGIHIFSSKENFSKIGEDEYYVIDLIGCDVFNVDKVSLGIVVDIKNFGAGDLIEITSANKRNFYIPMNDDNLTNVNILEKKIIVNPMKGLLD